MNNSHKNNDREETSCVLEWDGEDNICNIIKLNLLLKNEIKTVIICVISCRDISGRSKDRDQGCNDATT